MQGGALVFAKDGDLYEHAEHTRMLIGGVASPFNSWLILRGIRSLAARMRVHSENAMAIARLLAKNKRVEIVYYPGLETHARHDVARRQRRAFGGMLSFLVRGGRNETLAGPAETHAFVAATTLGGVAER